MDWCVFHQTQHIVLNLASDTWRPASAVQTLQVEFIVTHHAYLSFEYNAQRSECSVRNSLFDASLIYTRLKTHIDVHKLFKVIKTVYK